MQKGLLKDIQSVIVLDLLGVKQIVLQTVLDYTNIRDKSMLSYGLLSFQNVIHVSVLLYSWTPRTPEIPLPNEIADQRYTVTKQRTSRGEAF